MQFQRGQSGNPNGRPPGALNKRTHLARLLEPFAEELVLKVVELARNGDINALRMCIDRLIPKAPQESISFTLPDISNLPAHTPAALANEILKQLAGQLITLEQAKVLLSLNKDPEHISRVQKSDSDMENAHEIFRRILSENTKDY